MVGVRIGAFILTVAACALLAAATPGGAEGQEAAEGTPGGPNARDIADPQTVQQPEVSSDRLIVKFEPSESAAQRSSVRTEEGLDRVTDLQLIDAEVVEVGGRSAAAAARDLESRPGVEYAVPDRIVYPAGYADEPLFEELWGLHNTGQSVTGGLPGVADVDIDGLEASARNQGDPNLVVAVIDEGVDFSHPDLQANAWSNAGEIPDNGQDDDGNGYADDVNGYDFWNYDGSVYDPADGDEHGTHVAGTIAASMNGEGVVGVASNVKVMSLKFLGPSGGYLSDAILALEYAKAHGAEITNNSWSTELGPPDPALKDAIEASGMLFVAAAGNDAHNNDADPNNAAYPSSYDSPNIISVASNNNQGELSASSNYGVATVDMAAPGVDIMSTVPGGTWGRLSGTSMAAPHVAGVAALAASATPSLMGNPVLLKKAVLDGVKRLPASQGKTVTGGIANANLDITPPSVVSVSPADGAQRVPAYSTVEARFSEELRASTLDSVTFTLVKQGSTTAVPATVTYDAAEKRAVLTPNAGLTPSSTYTATLKGGNAGVKDLFGNPLAADKVWSFTVAPPDTTVPGTTITSGPGGYVSSKSVSFGFSSSEPSSTFRCRIDWEQTPSTSPPPFGPCESPKNYASLGEGMHMFEVKAVDYAGNVDPTPVQRSFIVDTGAPTVTAPSQSFVVPSTLSAVTFGYSIPMRISWSGSDPGGSHYTGIEKYELQRSVDGGASWSGDLLQQEPVPPAAGGPATSTTLSATIDATYKFRVRGKDQAGNWSPWTGGAGFVPDGYNQNHSSVTYPVGSWKRQDSGAAYAGDLKYAATDGARARFAFTGREVAWVAPKGPSRGRAQVFVDGTLVTTVDLYSSVAQQRGVVFRQAWATSGNHVTVVVLTGTKNASSTGTRVDVDAFLVERTP